MELHKDWKPFYYHLLIQYFYLKFRFVRCVKYLIHFLLCYGTFTLKCELSKKKLLFYSNNYINNKVRMKEKNIVHCKGSGLCPATIDKEMKHSCIFHFN